MGKNKKQPAGKADAKSTSDESGSAIKKPSRKKSAGKRRARPAEVPASDGRFPSVGAGASAGGLDALQQFSEGHVRLATSAAQMGIWAWDLETDTTTWDARESQLLGLEGERVNASAREFFDRVHSEDLPNMQRVIQRVCENLEPYDFEFRVVHPDGQVRWLAGKGEAVRDAGGKPVLMRGVNFDITDRKQLEQELRELNESLEQQVADRTAMLKLLQDVTRGANEARTIDGALSAALERIAQYNGWQIGHIWCLAGDGGGDMVSSGVWYATEQAEEAITRLDEFKEFCERHRFSPGEGMIGAVLESGEPKWVDDISQFGGWRRRAPEQFGLHAAIAFPVTAGGNVVAILEFFSDEPAERERRFMEIMPDVGIQLGRAIERKRLEKEVADVMAQQQHDFGRELHDIVQQQLTGTTMIAESVRQKLAAADSPLADDLQNVVQNVKDTYTQVRRLSRGLMPVEVDPAGLMSALEQLAKQTSDGHHVDCRYHCEQEVLLDSSTVATHLYRIAQEAVHNSVKYAKARNIYISLSDGNVIRLTITDNGEGFSTPATHGGQGSGSGLRIMRYRADLIGANLDVDSEKGKGTRVVCTLACHPD